MAKAKGKRADRESDRRWLMGYVDGTVRAHGGGVIELGDWSADYILSTPYGPLKVMVRAEPDGSPDIFQRFDTDEARDAGLSGVGYTGKWNFHLPVGGEELTDHARAWGLGIAALMAMKPPRVKPTTEVVEVPPPPEVVEVDAELVMDARR